MRSSGVFHLSARVLLVGSSLLASAPVVMAEMPVRTTVQRPFLWRIAGDPPSYLFGTIHLSDPRVTRLPPEVDAALAGADAVYTELPMDGVTMAKVAFKSLLPKGQRLAQILPEDLHARLIRQLEKSFIPVRVVDRMKVWAATQVLNSLDLLEEMQQQIPVIDQQIYYRAKKDKKEVGGIETVQEQIDVFDLQPLEEQIEGLNETLEELENGSPGREPPEEELIRCYLEGDEKKLIDLMTEEGDGDPGDAAFLVRLLDDRNVRMADRIAEKLRSHPGRSYFFAFGAAHFPGRKGVAHLLKDRGFEVERVSAPTAPRRLRLYVPSP